MPRGIQSTHKKSNPNSFILLAAGSGRKKSSPANLLSSGSLIYNQCKIIHNFDPEAEIINVIGFKSNLINDLDLPCRNVENVLFETTNVAESLRLAVNNAKKSNLYILHGDIDFNLDALKLDDPDLITVPVSPVIDVKKPGVLSEGSTLLNISYGIKPTWGQMFYIPAGLFDRFRLLINKTNKNFSLMDIINLVNLDYQIAIYQNNKAVYRECS